MKKIIGLDLSLTSTGWYVIDENNQCGQIKTSPKKFNNIMQRVQHISDVILQKIKEHGGVDLVIMQDYFVGKNCQTVIQLSVLGTIVRYKLLKNGIGYLAVAPTQIKKYSTGSGTAHKDNMLKIVFKNYGLDTESNNIADACAIAYLGKSYLQFVQNGQKSNDFKKYELQVLKKIVKQREIIMPYDKGEMKDED